MKQFLIIFLFLCAPLFAQQDVTIPGSGPSYVFGRSLVPNVSGGCSGSGTCLGGGLNNNFIVAPSNPNFGFCVQVSEVGGSGTLVTTLTISSTTDPSVTSFQATQGKWTQISQTPITTGAPSLTNIVYVPVSGGTRYAFTFSGTTATGVADVTLSQSQSGCQTQVPVVSNVYMVPFSCPLSASVVAPTGTTVKVAALPSPQLSGMIHVCAYSVTVGGAAVASVQNLFISGTGATCGTGTINKWRLQTGNTTSEIFELAASAGQIFDSGPGFGKDLCYTDGGTTAGSVVSVSYSIF